MLSRALRCYAHSVQQLCGVVHTEHTHIRSEGIRKNTIVALYHNICIHANVNVLTVIITNSNCDLICFNTTDSIQSTCLQSTNKGFEQFSNAVVDDWYHKFITWQASNSQTSVNWKLPGVKLKSWSGKVASDKECQYIPRYTTTCSTLVSMLVPTCCYTSDIHWCTDDTNFYWVGIDTKGFTP